VDRDLPGVLREASALLEAAGIEDARREARFLAGWALGVDAAGLLGRDRMPGDVGERFFKAVGRRVLREPMALIVGSTGFWTLDLAVSRDTLIPRADSEALVEAVLETWPDRDGMRSILDLGTGTGCLLLAVLKEYSQAWGIGVDLSPGAAGLARENARRNGLGERAGFLAGNWRAALRGRFDLVLSNPPYILKDEIAGLMPEVARFEPWRALDGGADGLGAYRHIVGELPDLLAPGGMAVLELGIGQGDAVASFAREAGLRELGRRCDYGGVERALVLGQGV